MVELLATNVLLGCDFWVCHVEAIKPLQKIGQLDDKRRYQLSVTLVEETVTQYTYGSHNSPQRFRKQLSRISIKAQVSTQIVFEKETQ